MPATSSAARVADHSGDHQDHRVHHRDHQDADHQDHHRGHQGADHQGHHRDVGRNLDDRRDHRGAVHQDHHRGHRDADHQDGIHPDPSDEDQDVTHQDRQGGNRGHRSAYDHQVAAESDDPTATTHDQAEAAGAAESGDPTVTTDDRPRVLREDDQPGASVRAVRHLEVSRAAWPDAEWRRSVRSVDHWK